ncbi:MAG TPA: hypothetical protein VMU41_04570 [Candidatus Binataceae bacterium]|nr:hypothetical protein [Candidatus Binataceae bacterium]
MYRAIKPLIAGAALVALFVLTPGLSHAQSTTYCYDHPFDNSHFCFCYHHPKECNGAYRSRYSDWNQPPDWRMHRDLYQHVHPEWYRGDWDHHAEQGHWPDHYAVNKGFHPDHPVPGHTIHPDRGHPEMRADGGHPNHDHDGHPDQRN